MQIPATRTRLTAFFINIIFSFFKVKGTVLFNSSNYRISRKYFYDLGHKAAAKLSELGL